jgi:hypothetical protein
MYTLQLFCLLAKTNASFKDIVVILDVLAMYIAAYSHQFNIALRLCSIVELTFINSTAYSENQLSSVLSNLHSTFLAFYVFLFTETKNDDCTNLEVGIDQMLDSTSDASLETCKLMCFGVERRDVYNLPMGDSVRLCRKMLSLLHPVTFCANPFYYSIFKTELTLKLDQATFIYALSLLLSVKRSRTPFSLSKLPIEMFRILKDFLI